MENIRNPNRMVELLRITNRKFIEEELINFLKIPSNTLNEKGIIKAKEFLVSYISEFCTEIKEFEGEINPLLFAKVEGNNNGTILIYMMYDTQPITKEKNWISGPFDAKISTLPKPLDNLGKCIIARGAYNSKTPLLCFLNVVKILKKNSSLPISLLLMFDGEEEIGSPTLLKFLEKKKDIFKNCMDAYYPATKQDLKGNAVLKLGYKGILSITIEVNSINSETHSAFSSIITNPALILVELLNSIYYNEKFKIDSLKNPYELSKEENLLMDDLLTHIDIDNVKQKAGISQLKKDDLKQAFKSYLFEPTFNISTLKSGFLEEGTKNIVPNSAKCNIDIRFAQNTTINEIFREIKRIVESYAIEKKVQIKLIKNIGYEGSRVYKNSILVESLLKSFQKLRIQSEIWPVSPAAAPLSKIQKELGLNFVVGGLGVGGFAHSPNEFIQVDSILNARLSNYYFLNYYALSK